MTGSATPWTVVHRGAKTKAIRCSRVDEAVPDNPSGADQEEVLTRSLEWAHSSQVHLGSLLPMAPDRMQGDRGTAALVRVSRCLTEPTPIMTTVVHRGAKAKAIRCSRVDEAVPDNRLEMGKEGVAIRSPKWARSSQAHLGSLLPMAPDRMQGDRGTVGLPRLSKYLTTPTPTRTVH